MSKAHKFPPPASFLQEPHHPPTTKKSVDSMASSGSGGDNAGNSSQQQQQQQGAPTQGASSTTTAPASTTTSAPSAPAPAPAAPPPLAPVSTSTIPASQTGLRGARWLSDEEDWVITRLIEWPELGWTQLTPMLNAEFQNRPATVNGQNIQRGNRNVEQVRQHFREIRHRVNERLRAQRNYFGPEDAAENSALADILLAYFEDVETPPSSAGGADKRREGGGDGGEGGAGAGIVA